MKIDLRGCGRRVKNEGNLGIVYGRNKEVRSCWKKSSNCCRGICPIVAVANTAAFDIDPDIVRSRVRRDSIPSPQDCCEIGR